MKRWGERWKGRFNQSRSLRILSATVVVVLCLILARGAEAVPTFQAAGATANGTAAITVVWPTHQADDIALLIVESANQAITLSTPAGFVEVTNSPQGTGTGGAAGATRLAVFWARATSSSMTSPVVADSGDHQVGRIITFRNVVTSGNPWNVTAGSVAATASTSVSVPTVTTTVADTLIVAIVANDTDTTTAQTSGWTNANLTGLIEQVDTNVTSGTGGGFAVATGVKATAGATGTTTATLATSSVQGRMTIALSPAPPTVEWTAASQASVDETGTLTVTAQLSTTSTSNVTVPFTLSGTATSGTDYTVTASPITINAGSTTGNATITITSDTTDEPDETVILTIGTPTNATLGTTTVHTATITDDDLPPPQVPVAGWPVELMLVAGMIAYGARRRSRSKDQK